MLYHFTTFDALLGILSSNKNDPKFLTFWATRVYELNDKQEMLFGYPSLMRFIEVCEDANKINPNWRISNICDEIDEKLLINHMYDETKSPFVVSLCELDDENEFPMWYIYGNQGKGVCLGFNESQWQQPETEVYNSFFSNVLYSNGQGEDILSAELFAGLIHQELNSAYNEIKECKDSKQLLDIMILTLGSICALISPFLKNKCFQIEKEHRLSCFLKRIDKRKNHIHFRTNNKGNLIPYVEIPIPTSSLQEIIIGPCCEKHNIKSLEFLLKLYNISSVQIKQSTLPFRII